METIKVRPEREWAVGMTQAQFEAEFTIRNPKADTTPDVREWLADEGIYPYPTVENFSPEMCNPEMDGRDRDAVMNEKIEEIPPERREKEVMVCACGRKFIAVSNGSRPIGMISHQRKCKEHLNKK